MSVILRFWLPIAIIFYFRIVRLYDPVLFAGDTGSARCLSALNLTGLWF